MQVNWKPVEDWLERDHEWHLDPDSTIDREILNVFKATLEFSTDTKRKAAKLAEDISFVNQAVEGGNCLPDIWDVILRIAWCLPPGHPWQDSLVQSMGNLCQRGEIPGTMV